jgi:hypothetical protein
MLPDFGPVLQLFGEFDPGSGRTLAACLTHASRTRSIGSLLPRRPSGERVSNAWATYLEVGDNWWKHQLIPNIVFWSHDLKTKVPALRDGPASH